MAASYPPVDNATLKALRKGDVSALEKIHRASYAAIVADAARQGGDPSFGPPVAELAMLTVWENHANHENEEDLQNAMQTAVRAGVTREQRRRATAKDGGRPSGGTVDSVWTRINAEIAKSASAPAASKHTEPKRKIERAAANDAGGRGGMIVVGVVLLIAAGFGGWKVMQQGDHGVAEGSFTASGAKPVSVQAGQRANLPLGPGDTAAIGSDSRVVVGGDYGTKVRAFKLDGSAKLHVSAGKHFEVDAKEVAITTSSAATFAVRAYKDDPAVIVSVKEGDVKVETPKESRTVGAGKAVAISGDGVISDPSAEAVDQALGWADGHVAFTNAPLHTVMSEFMRWYDLPVTTKDTSLLMRKVTMSVALESKKDAIAALEESAKVRFSYDKDSKPVLSGAPAGSKPAAKPNAKPAAKPAKAAAPAKKKK